MESPCLGELSERFHFYESALHYLYPEHALYCWGISRRCPDLKPSCSLWIFADQLARKEHPLRHYPCDNFPPLLHDSHPPFYRFSNTSLGWDAVTAHYSTIFRQSLLYLSVTTILHDNPA